MPIYRYKEDGRWAMSDAPPTDGRPCVAVTSNETYGMAVCMSVEAWERRLEAHRQATFDRDWRRAARQAEADCERELREKHEAVRKKVEDRRNLTRARWHDAVKNVEQARKVVAGHIEELYDLRWWHDKFHDGLALAIDAAALAIPMTSWTVAARLVAMGVVGVAGAGNAALKGAPDIAAGGGTGALADAGLGLLADGGDAYHIWQGQKIPGLGALGVVMDIKDVWDLFGSPDKFPFSSPESMRAVQTVKDYFNKYERDWLQDMGGPSKEEVDRSLDDLLDAMKKEQAARNAFQDALEARELERLGPEMLTCIEKRESQILGLGR
jgi:hypothetical protein